MKRTPVIAATTIAATLAIPAIATPHDAVVTCNEAGGYQVAPDYQHLSPTWTFTPTTVVVTWSDGYQITRPLPGPCTTPTEPTPAPEPTPKEETPTPPAPKPVTCADLIAQYPKAGPARRAQWGCPANPTKRPTVKPKPRPRIITCRFVVSHYRGAARTRMLTRHSLPATCGRPYNPPVTG